MFVVNKTLNFFKLLTLLVPVIAFQNAVSAATPDAADFFKNQSMSNAVMSPSGKYIAAIVKGGPKGRQGLVMIDINDSSKSKALAGFQDADIRSVYWVNDDRLVYTIVDYQSDYAKQVGTGLFSIDREGKDTAKPLINRYFKEETTLGTRIQAKTLTVNHYFYSTLRDGSDDVIVARNDYTTPVSGIAAYGEYKSTALIRLNTRTNTVLDLSKGAPNFTEAWAIDTKGNPRVAVTEVDGKSALYWTVKAGTEWQKVWEGKSFGEGSRNIKLIGISDKDILYASGYEDGRDTTSLLSYDLNKKEAKWQTLIALDGFDFDGDLILGEGGKLLGVKYLADAQSTYWFDANLKALQAKVDALLPTTINSISCGECVNPQQILVRAYSDRQPNAFLVYDAMKQTLSSIGASRPWIKADSMAKQEFTRFVARDGLSIPVKITKPSAQTKPSPAVVLVHGGPYARGGEWEWEQDAQFLAAQGYVVIEPEFRGSTGFGYKHYRAGWKQWGLAMQDDIADATLWAIKKGLVDAKKVCIAGASYGGYATLMGLIKHPDLYRCGVNWVGVTDINLMYTTRWGDFSSAYKEHGMPVLVGDPTKDAKQLAETSPIKLASKITQPLLLAYGGEDRRVPIEHGYKFRDAVKVNNKKVEWITYEDEGHGWFAEKNKIDFWNRVAQFLEKNLKE
jgi:dipeptidyl aminopeptidase/acylaminoacyl peptidase